VASELLHSAVDWYRSHFAYQYALQAGAKRIDLRGQEVGTVSDAEQYAAQIKIRGDKEKLSEKTHNNSVKTLHSLHANGRISSDQIKKLDAPPVPKPITPAAHLKRVYQALDAASSLMTQERDELSAAMAAAALGVVINEAQRVIDEVTDPHV
jgi:sRNA-binding protein